MANESGHLRDADNCLRLQKFGGWWAFQVGGMSRSCGTEKPEGLGTSFSSENTKWFNWVEGPEPGLVPASLNGTNGFFGLVELELAVGARAIGYAGKDNLAALFTTCGHLLWRWRLPGQFFSWELLTFPFRIWEMEGLQWATDTSKVRVVSQTFRPSSHAGVMQLASDVGLLIVVCLSLSLGDCSTTRGLRSAHQNKGDFLIMSQLAENLRSLLDL